MVPELHRLVAVTVPSLSEPVLMHDPISLQTLWWPPLVEHQGLLQSDVLIPCMDRLVGPRRLPVPGGGRPVGPDSVGVLPVPRGEEVPLSVPEFRLG